VTQLRSNLHATITTIAPEAGFEQQPVEYGKELIELGEKKGWELCENETTKTATESVRCSGVWKEEKGKQPHGKQIKCLS
jgi:hypothetical protein